MADIPFDFQIPVSFFEKADAEPGKQRRIGGVISTESPDRQGEIILQEGLDFSDFIANGWFNDNHTKDTDGILGYPEKVKRFKRGQTLPNGDKAKTNATWAEGYLLDTKRANDIWDLGKALAKTNRRLGYSVEGSIQKRIGMHGKTIAKAKVKEVAITKCPVNTDSKLEVLAKSLSAATYADDPMDKSLAMGPANPGGTPTGGAVLAEESLEDKKRKQLKQDMLFTDEDVAEVKAKNKKAKDKEVKKSLTEQEALRWVLRRRPAMSVDQAEKFVEVTMALKAKGRI